LVEAQQWAGGRRLSEVDYQYLTASQRLDTDRVKAEAEQIIAQLKSDAEKTTSKARQTRSRWTVAGVVVVTAMATRWAWYSYDIATLSEQTKQQEKDCRKDPSENSDLPANSLCRLIYSIKMTKDIRDNHSSTYSPYSYKLIEGLNRAFIDRWYESNTIEFRGAYSVAVSGDGKTIVSGSDDKTVKVWKRDGSRTTLIPGHQDVISSVAVSNDGQTIVSGSQDKTVKVWSGDGSPIATFPDHQGIISSVVVSGDGQTIASVNFLAKIVKVWNKDGSFITTLSSHQDSVTSVVVSNDGQIIVSGSEDKTVKVWSRDGSPIATLSIRPVGK
jgi:WD domain, G-beta repeat